MDADIQVWVGRGGASPNWNAGLDINCSTYWLAKQWCTRHDALMAAVKEWRRVAKDVEAALLREAAVEGDE